MAGAPPLDGIRVLDLSHVLAGPFATYQLALLGAEVTRIEHPDGTDFVRRHGGTEAMKAAGLGASFLSQNAGKRSVALDLKTAAGRDACLRLAARADVVMENFRPGVVDRLGVGFEAVRAVSPDIVYCSLTGYGQDGPLAGAPAYDHILQGISGMMAMTGTAESGPLRVGFPIVDYIAGQQAALGILAALHRRRAGQGGAQYLGVPMLDSLVAMMAAYAVHWQTTGTLRGLEGNRAFSDSPFSGVFDTADGQLVITANTAPQARRLSEALGLPDLPGAPEAEIAAALRTAFRARDAAAWEARLAAVHVPAAKLRTLAEILAHPQMRAGGLMRPMPVPELGMEVAVPGSPVQTDAWETPAPAPAPTLGRDTEAVLLEAGFSAAEIAALRAEGALG